MPSRKKPPVRKPQPNRARDWFVLAVLFGICLGWALFRLRVYFEEPLVVVDPPFLAMQLDSIRSAGFLGEWIQEPQILFEIKNALWEGRLVNIRNVLAAPIAEKLRAETMEIDHSNWTLVSSAGTRAMLNIAGVPNREVWRGANEQVNMCQGMHQELNGLRNQMAGNDHNADLPHEWEVFSQYHLLKYKAPGTTTYRELKAFMESAPMRELLCWLVGGPVATVESQLSKQHVGDFAEPYTGNAPGKLLTAQFFISQDTFNTTRDGGAFIWCLPFTQFIEASFNSLALFRNNARSWHVLEPVWSDQGPQRYEMLVEYKMAGDEEWLRRNSQEAIDWAEEDSTSDQSALVIDW